MLLVKGVAVGLGLLAANVFAVATGTTTDGPLNAVWAVVVVSSGCALVALLRRSGAAPSARTSSGARDDGT